MRAFFCVHGIISGAQGRDLLKLLDLKHILAMPGSPARRTLYKWANHKPRYNFVHQKGEKFYFDVEDPEWLGKLAYLAQFRKNQKAKGTTQDRSKKRGRKKGKPHPKPADFQQEPLPVEGDPIKTIEQRLERQLNDPSSQTSDMEAAVKCLKMIEELKNKQISNRLDEIKLKKQQYDIIDWSLAHFLFFGFMERTNTELVGFKKKMYPVFKNYFDERDFDGLMDRLARELTVIMTEVKKAQEMDLKKWQADNGVQ